MKKVTIRHEHEHAHRNRTHTHPHGHYEGRYMHPHGEAEFFEHPAEMIVLLDKQKKRRGQ